jgi:hypothetical protein
MRFTDPTGLVPVKPTTTLGMKAHDAFYNYVDRIALKTGRMAYCDETIGDIIGQISSRINQGAVVD